MLAHAHLRSTRLTALEALLAGLRRDCRTIRSSPYSSAARHAVYRRFPLDAGVARLRAARRANGLASSRSSSASSRIGFAYQGGYEPAGPDECLAGRGSRATFGQRRRHRGLPAAKSSRNARAVGRPVGSCYLPVAARETASRDSSRAAAPFAAATTMGPTRHRRRGRSTASRSTLLIHPHAISPARYAYDLQERRGRARRSSAIARRNCARANTPRSAMPVS